MLTFTWFLAIHLGLGIGFGCIQHISDKDKQKLGNIVIV